MASNEFGPVLHAFGRLLTTVGLEPEGTVLWRDWVDSDDIRFTLNGIQGKEDLDWMFNDPPFRALNSLAADLSELQILTPLSSESLLELSQFVTVLPTTHLMLNVNTASDEVLESLVQEDTLAVRQRGPRGRRFGILENFLELHPQYQSIGDRLSVQSSYFEVQAELQAGVARLGMTSHLYRNPLNGVVQVYARRFGVKHAWAHADTG